MGFYDDLYANDEDVAIEAPGDFSRLVPDDQRLAEAKDGIFVAGSPWVLTSPSINFATNGIEPGLPVVLTKGSQFSAATNTNAATPDLVFVSSVNSGTGALTLRRKGFISGLGSPPGNTSTGNTGVHFRIPTAIPQLIEATRILRERFRFVNGSILTAAMDLKRPCVLLVMIALYEALARQADKDDYWKKAQGYRKELMEQYAILDETYGPSPMGRRIVVAVMPPTLLTPQLDTDGYRYPTGYGG